jgi:ribosomal protein S18 acetylase RimI-like enzyme
MEPVISPASEAERNWAATMLANTEPWVRLGVQQEQLLKTCHDPEYQLFIAHLNDTPCGVLIIDPHGIAGSPYIKSIAVSPGNRSSGIGAKMVSFAETRFSKQSKHIFLCVSSFNDRARKFYSMLGYSKVGEFENYIIHGESEILMYKKIA